MAITGRAAWLAGSCFRNSRTSTMKKLSLLAAAALLATAWTVTAQPSDNSGSDPQDNPPPGARRHQRPPLPIVTALDTNHDGVIDANEIANAPAALKTLDKNG